MQRVIDRLKKRPSAQEAVGASAIALDRLESLLLGEIQDRDEVRTGSVAWNELRATAVFEEELRAPLARTTATWNSRIRAALDDADAPGDREQLATVLTALVEGLSGRWLGDEVSTKEAQELLRTAIRQLIDPTGTTS